MFVTPSLLSVIVSCSLVSSGISAPARSASAQWTQPSPIDYLGKYGYITTGVQHSPASLESAIRAFQRFAGLEQTGLLDEATRAKLQARRCGVEDVVGTARMGVQELEGNGTSRFKRYSTSGRKWSRPDLTYRFNSFTPDLGRAETRDAVRRAFGLWADASPLTFTESLDDASGDIIIDFVSGEHSDGPAGAFDGPGGTLAHAFSPENGDAHFDEDETFTVGSQAGINLFIVAAHEFGHSLGLAHSDDHSALMFPWYQGYVEDYHLPQDDINGIQQLYGKPDVERDPSTSGGSGAGTGANLPACDSRWEAATYYAPDDVVYAFNGQYVWAIDDQGVMEGYPTKTKTVFPDAPSGVHAVVSVGSRTYMFKGKKMWRFYGKRLEAGFPRTKPAGMPSKPDAALLWGGDGKIYVFKGSRFYEFYEHDLSTVGQSMKIADHWGGVPTKPDAALQWKNGKTYFFRNNKYWRFNDNKMTIAKDYPESRSTYWMGCGLADGQELPAKIVLPPNGAQEV